MENARDALSLARIAGRVGFAGPTLSVFSPLLAGFFLSLGRILWNLEQGFHALLKILLRFLSFVIFVFFWHKITFPMFVLLALVLLQSPSSPVHPKHPIVEQSTSSGAKKATPNNGQRNLPPTQGQNTGAPSAPQAASQENNKEQKPTERIYKVDVVSPPTKPLDTPLFPWYLLLTGVGVFVNFWIACLIYRQSKSNNIAALAAKKSADTAELALRIAERADLLLDKAGLNSGSVVTPHSRIQLFYKNFGKTRAIAVRSDIELIIPNVPKYEGKDNIMPETTIGAGDNCIISFHHFQAWITEHMFNQIFSGKIELRFRAEITYKDVFGDCHHTWNEGLFEPRSRTFMLTRSEAD